MSNYRLENDELGTNLGLIFASILGQEAPIGPGKKEQNKASKKEKATKKGGKEESKADTSPLQGKKKKKKESHAGSSATSTKKQPGVSYDKPVDDATIDYGVGSRSTPSGPAAHERFYVTTAINYTNGHPHMGHAYEAVTTDVLARFHRLEGKQVFFLTGTDEHGQKIASTAEGLGITPIQLCDKYVDCFKALNQRLKISNDNYVRTTDPAHEEVCRQLWRKCAAAGDIYLGKYEGWYNVKEETFVTDMEAEAAGFKDEHGLPLKRMSEESYFFRLSNYQERLVAHIEAHPEFVRPEMYRNNILNRLRDPKKPLGDLSISRTTFEWGVRVPEGFDQKHVMYVWFDALTNYLSGVRGLDPSAGTAAFWPASCHIIGKDIVWFHTVIWPCMLMSANVPLPTTVYSHGFINDKEGKKMSKSLGNVVDPHDELDKYPSDTFRWYLCREAPYGSELSFSEESLVLMHNSELADTLGNLAHRAFNLLKKYNDGVMPPPARDTGVPLPFDLGKVRAETCAAVASFQLQVACRCAIAGVQDVNKWITELEPWKMKGEGQAARRLEVVRLAAEALYAAAHLLGAFVPDAATALFAKIGHPPSALLALSPDFDNVPSGTQTAVGDILFAKLEVGGPAAAAAAATEERGAGKKKEGAGAGGGGKKKEQKKKAPAGGKGGAAEPAAETEATSDFPLLEIRVGRITKVWEHPEAERLFCEEIDVGEAAGPRRIASGLREHYTLAEMEGRAVCVVCNLKPAKLAGFASAGMVLAACGADGKVELVDPPAGAQPGDLITAEGHTGAFASAAAVKKKKIMEKVAAELATDAGRAACYRGAPLAAAPHGPLTCPTLAGAPIH